MATPRKKPAVDTPADVAFNLDTYEFEDTERKPFVAVIGGKRLTFTDPMNVAWQDLADIDSPFGFAEACLSEADRKHFLEHRVPARALNALMEAYKEHYGLVQGGNSGA